MLCGGEHVIQPANGADVPVGLKFSLWWLGWCVPEVQDGFHSIHMLLPEHAVEQNVSKAVVEYLAVSIRSYLSSLPPLDEVGG